MQDTCESNDSTHPDELTFERGPDLRKRGLLQPDQTPGNANNQNDLADNPAQDFLIGLFNITEIFPEAVFIQFATGPDFPETTRIR